MKRRAFLSCVLSSVAGFVAAPFCTFVAVPVKLPELLPSKMPMMRPYNTQINWDDPLAEGLVGYCPLLEK